MSVFQGTRETRYMNLKQAGAPIDITGWEFRATLRRLPTSEDSLGELTTANNGFVTVDAVNGRLAMLLDDSLTATLPVGRIHFDVLYENAADGPVWLFGGSFIVKKPVTR